ncbi:TPM domain-containing protein [Aerococcus urinae]|nr:MULTISPECIES: TPM domain-containing protein [Aerococcus]KAA9219177.1 TPM domain-containing protein [Aerococcus loyolae]KAA9264210.1 TPM domain-containing protein [Aerococcus loyolae]MCY3084074.1 TPM domain-containing protein [Aerococcus mictus]MDK6231523.1 TPM domain-containing protein [Aerococcus urinae]MDK6257521.1 TPM domain-containing protein [Aerococcus urinae]
MKNEKKRPKLISCSSELSLLAILLGITAMYYFTFRTYRQPDYPAVSQEYYVSDYSQRLNDFTTQHMMTEGYKLEELTQAKLAVVVLPRTENVNRSKYSQTLASQWGMTATPDNEWALLLFKTDVSYPRETSVDNPYLHLEIGGGLKDELTNPEIEEVVEQYDNDIYHNVNNYDQAAFDSFNAVAGQIYRAHQLEVPSSLSQSYKEVAQDSNHQSKINSSLMQADLKQAESQTLKNPAPLYRQLGKAFFATVCTLLALVVTCLVAFFFATGCISLAKFIAKIFHGDED